MADETRPAAVYAVYGFWDAERDCRSRRSLSGYLGECLRRPECASLKVSHMPHAPPLVATIALGLVLAFSLGVAAHRLKLPPLVGYLVAGILIGPFTRSEEHTSELQSLRHL